MMSDMEHGNSEESLRYFYAASTGGFYCDRIHEEIPGDAVNISATEYQILLEGQAAGQCIRPPDAEHPQPYLDNALPPSIEEARHARLAELMHAYNAAFTPMEAKYPAREREGWTVQEAEARAVLADSQAATPVLSLLTQLRNKGESVPELAAIVLDNAQRWRSVYALLTGAQQRMYAEISALASVEEILGYTITFQLPEGM